MGSSHAAHATRTNSEQRIRYTLYIRLMYVISAEGLEGLPAMLVSPTLCTPRRHFRKCSEGYNKSEPLAYILGQ